jgi:hypothetical protein
MRTMHASRSMAAPIGLRGANRSSRAPRPGARGRGRGGPHRRSAARPPHRWCRGGGGRPPGGGGAGGARGRAGRGGRGGEPEPDEDEGEDGGGPPPSPGAPVALVGHRLLWSDSLMRSRSARPTSPATVTTKSSVWAQRCGMFRGAIRSSASTPASAPLGSRWWAGAWRFAGPRAVRPPTGRTAGPALRRRPGRSGRR